MLVISRKIGEWVDLEIDGQKVASVCIEFKEGHTKLVFDLSPSVIALRREVLPEVKKLIRERKR